jgi:DNA (cytosine-5)-methyltransferase 1
MAAYYNENDEKAAAWLRALIKAELIADGDVDTRSIEDVRPDDLRGFVQCHFFAGIGGWSYALRLAGWPDDRHVWTGSCPCQPFSVGGKGAGFTDERHLWPAWYWLIDERRPVVIAGEQVESPAGRAWLDLVSTDLEAVDYTFSPVDLPVACVGAPGIRQRLFWLADREDADRRRELGINGRTSRDAGHVNERIPTLGLGYSFSPRLEGHGGDGGDRYESRRLDADSTRSIAAAGATRGAWRDADWLLCRDQKVRPVEPGTFPLAHGIPARVGRLRGYGNAIVPQVAAAFIEAYLDVVS